MLGYKFDIACTAAVHPGMCCQVQPVMHQLTWLWSWPMLCTTCTTCCACRTSRAFAAALQLHAPNGVGSAWHLLLPAAGAGDASACAAAAWADSAGGDRQ